MQISKQRPHGEICATDLFWYYICVTNTSTVPMTATNAVITDLLPEGIAPYSVLVSEPGAFDGLNTVRWDLGTMAPGDHACVWIRAQTYSSAAGRHITNRAWLDADELPGPILATDVAYVYLPPCPPLRTVTPPPTGTPTPNLTPTAAPTSMPTPTPAATAGPSTGGIVACLWNDLDGDGARDGHEAGLPGLGIEVRDDGGQFVDACSTDPAGCCTIIGLPPGLYSVIGGAAPGSFFTTSRSVDVQVHAGRLHEISFGSREFHRLHLPVIVKLLG
jgi:uncharacterized repeat protein (TIGR01451 family)